MHPYLFVSARFSLLWENVAILVGILAALWLTHRRSAAKGMAYQEMLLDLALYLIPAGMIGGRVWDVAFTWHLYKNEPLQALAIWGGGMSVQGALLGGLVAALLFARRRGLRVWELLDVLAPPVILGQAIGRIGCLMSGDAFGRPIKEVGWLPQWLGVVYAPNSPAGQIYGQTPLVPAEGLEMAADFLIVAFLLIYRPKREIAGRTVLLYAMLYSAARFGLEYFRTDSLLVGGVKVAQALSVTVIAVAGVMLGQRYRAVTASETIAG